MLSRGDVRVCIAYSEMDDEMENSVKDELERRESIALGRLHLSRSLRMFKHMRHCGAMLWLLGWPPTYRCSRATARGNDEVGKIVESHCGTQ